MKKAMAAAAPPGCDRKDTTDLGWGGKKDSHPAAKQHQREGLFHFQQLHDDDEDDGAVVKAPKCLAQGEIERGEPRRSSRSLQSPAPCLARVKPKMAQR